MLDTILKDKNNILIKREITKIKNLSPASFEKFVADLFSDLGFKAEQTPPTNDGGKDVVLLKDGKTYYVECKHYTDGPVGREIIQKAYGASIFDGAFGCFVVTSSHFNLNVLEMVEKQSNLFLLDLYDLAQLSAYIKTGYSQKAESHPKANKENIIRTDKKTYNVMLTYAVAQFYRESLNAPAWIHLCEDVLLDVNNSRCFHIDNTWIAFCTTKDIKTANMCESIKRYVVDCTTLAYAVVPYGTSRIHIDDVCRAEPYSIIAMMANYVLKQKNKP